VEHDGLEAARFPPPSPEARAAARLRLGIPAEARAVVYTGGLLPWKGVDLLVEAARTCPEYLFVVAGGMQADVERLRARAGGLANVRIDGFQPPGRVADYLLAGDVGAVPNRSAPAISARHTSPLKVFEAMASGLPLVASDLPSMREVLEPELDAVLVAPDDAAALAAGLRRLMEDDGLRARLRDRSLARAPAHTWDARARRLLAWMDERIRT
jgi:glycosyltransferase involved in cell wall biosynthesis